MTGFATIKAGITLNSTISGVVFEGTNTEAAFLNISGSTNDGNKIAGANFLRSDEADTTAGRITINSNDGLVVGTGSELLLTVDTNDVKFRQQSNNKDIIFEVN